MPKHHISWARNFSELRSADEPFSRTALRGRIRSAALNLLGRVTPIREQSFVRCLYLHYVYDDQVDTFRQLLVRLQKIGKFVSTDRVVRFITGGEPLDGRFFHLSFDDGFDNNHRNAFPILRELDIPAIFFIPTGLIGVADQVLADNWWLTTNRGYTRTMDWDRVREMTDAGFEFGSHTRYHRRLSEISTDSGILAAEIAGSREEIRRQTGTACRYISWPYGGSTDIDERAVEAIRDAGYEAAFSAVRGRVTPKTTSRLDIPRHHIEPEWPWPHVRYFAAGGREPR